MGLFLPLDEGATGQAVDRRTPVVIDDYGDLRAGQLPPGHPVGHGAVLPRFRRGRRGEVIGVNVVFAGRRCWFTHRGDLRAEVTHRDRCAGRGERGGSSAVVGDAAPRARPHRRGGPRPPDCGDRGGRRPGRCRTRSPRPPPTWWCWPAGCCPDRVRATVRRRRAPAGGVARLVEDEAAGSTRRLRLGLAPDWAPQLGRARGDHGRLSRRGGDRRRARSRLDDVAARRIFLILDGGLPSRGPLET